MMLHRHFAEKNAEEELKAKEAQELEKEPVAEKVEEGADIVPEPAEKPVEKTTAARTRRKK